VFLFWRGRGWWVTWIVALALFAPMLLLQQVDGPAVDRGVALSTALAALAVAGLGLRMNRGGGRGEPARHSFWGVPLQFWALPLLLFSALLATGTITTAEEPPPTWRSPRAAGASKQAPGP